METTHDKSTFWVLMIVMGTIFILTALAYHFRQDLDITRKLKYAKEQFLTQKGLYVKFQVVASIGDKSLRLQFSVPCKSLKQKHELFKKIPGIKHEMLMALSSPEMIQSVEQRNFHDIKENSLRVVNSFTKKTIKRIYVELFFLN